jgi:hypothetical protein
MSAAPSMEPYPKAGPIDVPQRILMGPGPSNSHPRALAAMSLPQLGHMHPPFLKVHSSPSCCHGLANEGGRALTDTAS